MEAHIMAKSVPAWSMLKKDEFTTAIKAASRTEPDILQSLRHAISVTAARRGVPQHLANQ